MANERLWIREPWMPPKDALLAAFTIGELSLNGGMIGGRTIGRGCEVREAKFVPGAVGNFGSWEVNEDSDAFLNGFIGANFVKGGLLPDMLVKLFAVGGGRYEINDGGLASFNGKVKSIGSSSARVEVENYTKSDGSPVEVTAWLRYGLGDDVETEVDTPVTVFWDWARCRWFLGLEECPVE